MKLRFTKLLFVLIFVVGLAACGGGAAPAAPAAPAEAPAAAEPTAAPVVQEEAPASDGYGEAAPAATEAPAEAAEPTAESVAEEAAPAAAPAAAGARTYTIIPAESQVSYAVDEQFLREGVVDFTAVGVTQEIEGTVMFDAANPQASTVGPITINISTFKSDDERRDNAIRDRWLESARFPIATFQTTSIDGLPESYTFGDEITLQINGDLTVRDVTQPVTFETTGVIDGDEMRGTATTTVLMTDFGFDPPDILNVLRAENEVAITFDFVARAE